jgi:hypothetical protein
MHLFVQCSGVPSGKQQKKNIKKEITMNNPLPTRGMRTAKNKKKYPKPPKK